MSVSRRDVLKSLSMGAAATSVLRVIPLQAAEYAHHMIAGKGHEQSGRIHAQIFLAAAVQDLQALCESIFPADNDRGELSRRGLRSLLTC